jgi:hypothetical protein
MAQRKRVRASRTVWVGALAVFFGGVTGCFTPEKDKPINPPPQAKGSGFQTTTGVIGPNGQRIPTSTTGTGTTSPYGNNTAGMQPGTGGSITSTAGQYPPGYRPSGPGYDPMGAASPNNPGAIGTPIRPTSATQFNSYPATNSMVPPVGPSGGSSYQTPSSGYGAGSMSSPSSTGYGSPSSTGYGSPSSTGYGTPSGSSPYSAGGSTSGYQRSDPTPPSMSDTGPIPPAAPSSGLAPSVAPYSPAGTPTPPMAPLSPAGGYGGYPKR